MKEEWDNIYTDEYRSNWYPMDGIVRFTARYLKRRIGIDRYEIKKDVKKILDVGCGNGNHVHFFAKQGFEVYGIDISEEAINIAKDWMKKEGLTANLRAIDAEKLPFEDKFFDVIISHGVLDHISFSKAKKTMDEIKRVLKPNGYAFITLRSTEDCEFGRGEKTEKNTYILQKGYEKGLIQHYFNLEEIKELFSGFKIFDLNNYQDLFPGMFTIDKSFMQSSKNIKKYIDLSSHVYLNLKYSRWYVAAEKV